MEFRGQYGNADSLAMKGIRSMHSEEKTAKQYQEAYNYFEKALSIDEGEPKSLYFMGLMNLLGYGRDQNIEAAAELFKRKELEKDPRALNALGFIYYSAPKPLEQDPVKLN